MMNLKDAAEDIERDEDGSPTLLHTWHGYWLG